MKQHHTRDSHRESRLCFVRSKILVGSTKSHSNVFGKVGSPGFTMCFVYIPVCQPAVLPLGSHWDWLVIHLHLHLVINVTQQRRSDGLSSTCALLRAQRNFFFNPCAAFGSHDLKVHNESSLCLPNTNTNIFILTFAMWGVWDSPTVKRKCFTLFLYAVKFSQYTMGHN